MRWLNPSTISRVYLIVLLLLAVLVSSPFQVGLALVLLGVQLFVAYRPPKPGLNLTLVFVSLVLAPLALEALAGPVGAALLVVPALFLLDSALMDFAAVQVYCFSRVGRRVSNGLKAFATGLALVFLVSVVLWSLTLALTVAVLFVYLAVALTFVYQRMPKASLQESKTWSRLVAGESDSRVVNIKGKASVPSLVSLQLTEIWARIEPSRFTLARNGQADVTLSFSPDLAGPSSIQVQACDVDSRGLVVVGQVLHPVDLHVIPRAKFAHWLANKFLNQTSGGAGIIAAVPTPSSRAAGGSVEFYGSRPYQVGDRWKDLDWRHSYKLGELITNEYSGGQGRTAILVVNLAAKDAVDADKLAYNCVMSALTLAREGLPTALAAYDDLDVIEASAPLNPRETLKNTLKLTEKIRIVAPRERVLQATRMRSLKRSIGLLIGEALEPAQKLREALELEVLANKELAKHDPAARALMKTVEYVSGSAIITLISSIGYDSDALLTTLEQLREKGFSTITLALAQTK